LPFIHFHLVKFQIEFATYGLSEAMVYIIDALKIISALALFISIWILRMHIKVKDSLLKSLPATIFLLLSLLIIGQAYY